MFSGSAIHEPLALTFPDPADPTDPLGMTDSPLIRRALTVDFDQAERSGWGSDSAFQRRARDGLTRVIVFGVKSSLAPDVSAGGIQELLGIITMAGLRLATQEHRPITPLPPQLRFPQ
jgi:hypothetical protein